MKRWKKLLLKFGNIPPPKCKDGWREFALVVRKEPGFYWQARSSAVTRYQHAPVLPLALQCDVTCLSVRQQAPFSSYLPHQSTDLIQSDLQRQKAFEPFGDDLLGGHQRRSVALIWWMRASARGIPLEYLVVYDILADYICLSVLSVFILLSSVFIDFIFSYPSIHLQSAMRGSDELVTQ